MNKLCWVGDSKHEKAIYVKLKGNEVAHRLQGALTNIVDVVD